MLAFHKSRSTGAHHLSILFFLVLSRLDAELGSRQLLISLMNGKGNSTCGVDWHRGDIACVRSISYTRRRLAMGGRRFLLMVRRWWLHCCGQCLGRRIRSVVAMGTTHSLGEFKISFQFMWIQQGASLMKSKMGHSHTVVDVKHHKGKNMDYWRGGNTRSEGSPHWWFTGGAVLFCYLLVNENNRVEEL